MIKLDHKTLPLAEKRGGEEGGGEGVSNGDEAQSTSDPMIRLIPFNPQRIRPVSIP